MNSLRIFMLTLALVPGGTTQGAIPPFLKQYISPMSIAVATIGSATCITGVIKYFNSYTELQKQKLEQEFLLSSRASYEHTLAQLDHFTKLYQNEYKQVLELLQLGFDDPNPSKELVGTVILKIANMLFLTPEKVSPRAYLQMLQSARYKLEELMDLVKLKANDNQHEENSHLIAHSKELIRQAVPIQLFLPGLEIVMKEELPFFELLQILDENYEHIYEKEIALSTELQQGSITREQFEQALHREVLIKKDGASNPFPSLCYSSDLVKDNDKLKAAIAQLQAQSGYKEFACHEEAAIRAQNLQDILQQTHDTIVTSSFFQEDRIKSEHAVHLQASAKAEQQKADAAVLKAQAEIARARAKEHEVEEIRRQNRLQERDQELKAEAIRLGILFEPERQRLEQAVYDCQNQYNRTVQDKYTIEQTAAQLTQEIYNLQQILDTASKKESKLRGKLNSYLDRLQRTVQNLHNYSAAYGPISPAILEELQSILSDIHWDVSSTK
jgi:hypothetical protein